MKKIGRSDIIGQRGMAHIQGVVNAMDFMFYPTGGVEAGIDGYIELRDAVTGEVMNALLQVQGKATERDRLQGDDGATFEFPCSEADIAYWLEGTAPVLLVYVALKEGRAYWKSIKEWFSDPARVKARKIVFDREKDEFNRGAKAAIVAVASNARPGASGPSVRIHEDLLTNLVGVGFAPRLFWAPTRFGSDRAFGAALRELDPKAGGEWIVRSKSVLSFHDLNRLDLRHDWPAMRVRRAVTGVLQTRRPRLWIARAARTLNAPESRAHLHRRRHRSREEGGFGEAKPIVVPTRPRVHKGLLQGRKWPQQDRDVRR